MLWGRSLSCGGGGGRGDDEGGTELAKALARDGEVWSGGWYVG